MSSARSLEVTSSSPSAVAFFSALADKSVLASVMSFVANSISSVRDCFSISKLCLAVVSLVLALSSWSFAFSRRLSRVSTMEPPWCLYTAGSGAPRESSESPSASATAALPCTSAVSLAASCEPSIEASTRTLTASRTLLAFCSWSMAPPPLRISRSRMPMARSIVEMMSTSSVSDAAKSATSFARMAIAAFRSASLVAMLEANSSILADAADASAEALSMVAFSSLTSDLPVLISKLRSLERSSHHSANSA
mmetsp:Transcript_62711/g.164490  ORF Transcript_62711/g.164490 Transcript_62711/m.164490 type:complete len:252 (-) Transcript_62711:235-990(-)